MHGRSQINFISWQRQNQTIDAVSTFIKKSIKVEMDQNNFFSSFIDITFNSSRREQLAFIICYVYMNGQFTVIQEQL